MKKTLTTLTIALIILFFASPGAHAVNNTNGNSQYEGEFGAFEGDKSSETFNLTDEARGFILTTKQPPAAGGKEEAEPTSLLSSFGPFLFFLLIFTIILVSLIFYLSRKKAKENSGAYYQNR